MAIAQKNKVVFCCPVWQDPNQWVQVARKEVLTKREEEFPESKSGLTALYWRLLNKGWVANSQ